VSSWLTTESEIRREAVFENKPLINYAILERFCFFLSQSYGLICFSTLNLFKKAVGCHEIKNIAGQKQQM